MGSKRNFRTIKRTNEAELGTLSRFLVKEAGPTPSLCFNQQLVIVL